MLLKGELLPDKKSDDGQGHQNDHRNEKIWHRSLKFQTKIGST
jgi:hypothetical protein